MEAKDTVIKLTMDEKLYLSEIEQARLMAKRYAQAEISFKAGVEEGEVTAYKRAYQAGIKEVVDTYRRENLSAYKKYKSWWQSKLKEWGIE